MFLDLRLRLERRICLFVGVFLGALNVSADIDSTVVMSASF